MTLSSRELELLSNTDVLGYIQAENAKLNAKAKAEGWEFWTLMAESLADEHANVYELELRLARGTYSDVYKEWAGIRPSIPQDQTLAQLEAEIELMSVMVDDSHKAEQEWLAKQDRMEREEVALGMKRPASDMKLEQWEVYEAKAEAMGY